MKQQKTQVKWNSMEQTKYDVFISYSRKDYVDEKGKVIQNNEISKIIDALTKAEISFWIDQEGIKHGEDFGAKIITCIKASKIFVYLSTAAANDSDWTRKEITCAWECKKKIIPVRIDDSPFHNSVMLRIANLDRIEYYVNPQQGIEKLISAIKVCLEELAAEKKHKRKEEERRQRKEEEREVLPCQEPNYQEAVLTCSPCPQKMSTREKEWCEQKVEATPISNAAPMSNAKTFNPAVSRKKSRFSKWIQFLRRDSFYISHEH